MTRMTMDSQVPFLPRGIITNILKRLPVKTLIRFRCVCKDWENLLKTPHFIAGHLHHSGNQNTFLLFTQYGGNHLTSFDLLSCEMQRREVRNVHVIERIWDRLVASCNGLLCFQNDKSDPPSFLLWNPATQEVRQVPRPLPEFDGHVIIGFGFCPILNDYKIVVNYVAQFCYEVNRVQVYSLSTGLWKEIDFENLGGVSPIFQSITVNGFIFWLGLKQVVKGQFGDDDFFFIVSFDMAKEVFTVIPLPALDYISFPSLTVYENKLAFLISTKSENSEYSVELWVMEEDINATREMSTWTKKYTSNTYPCFLSPVTIWRGEVVCKVVVMPEPIGKTNLQEKNNDPTTVLYLFNLTTHGFEKFPMGRLSQDYAIVNYIESLVPLGNSHFEEL